MSWFSWILLILIASSLSVCGDAFAQSGKPSVSNSASSPAAAEIDREVDASLKKLYASSPSAKALGAKAKAVLVFPSIVKGGLIVGAQYGKGALRQGGKPAGYFESVAGSYGFQAGVQKFGYALFLMNDAALASLDRADGWELGVGPSITVVDTGKAKSISTTTMRDDVYAVFFDQKGLMAGAGVQGSKVTRINP
jgi:lipid-binding SYLF domain-containing protein